MSPFQIDTPIFSELKNPLNISLYTFLYLIFLCINIILFTNYYFFVLFSLYFRACGMYVLYILKLNIGSLENPPFHGGLVPDQRY